MAVKALICMWTSPEWSTRLNWVGSNPGNLRGFQTKWMKERLDTIKFLDVTTSMLPNGIPFPVIPQAPEIMNIIVPDMLQNALTGNMTVDEAAEDAAAKGRGSSSPACRPDVTQDRPAAAVLPVPSFRYAGTSAREHRDGTGDCRSGAGIRRRSASGLLERVVDHRADYLYVLPALVVMLVVIAYPIYYTIELSFFKTPANLQMKDKVWVGLDNYVTVLTSESFRSRHRSTP